MKYIASILLIIVNLINVPLNNAFKHVKKWYLPIKKKDKILYYAFAPFYCILVALSFIFAHISEKLLELAH